MTTFLLMRLLLKDRWRKLQLQYGWAARLSTCLVLGIGAWMLASVAARLVRDASQEQIVDVLNTLIAAWVIAGVLTGKDLTWHTRLERLLVFRLSFLRLYASALILGFLTFPMLLCFCLLEISVAERSAGHGAMLFALPGFALLVCGVRAMISLVRTALFRAGALSRPVRYILWILIACLIASAVVLGVYHIAGPLPGYQFSSIFLGVQPLEHLALTLVVVGLLIAADYVAQRDLVYSGIAGPLGLRVSRKGAGKFLLLRPSPSRVLWLISLLGWFRNRNALLLLIWGALYGFGYTYFTKAGSQIYFAAFCWMVLIFHSYLRGNILGVDNKGVWLYYVLPFPIENAVRAKNSALSFVQAIMIGGVLLPAVLRATPGMTTAVDWIGILSFAACGVLLGEIFGSIFSVLHPEPIERTSMYSGGTTPGAFLVPLLQTAILAVLLVPAAAARRNLSPLTAVVAFASVPVLLWAVRTVLLRSWVRNRMVSESESIQLKLMGS